MLKSWCNKKHFNNADNISHVLIDGGILSIPDEYTDEFNRVYIKSLETEQLFVVEQKTECFNFFVDIDYVDVDMLGIEEIKSISEIVCNKVDSLSETRALVSISKPKPKSSKIKSGVHINFPDLVVNQSNAINLMNHIINVLNSVYSGRDWSKVIDDSVYGNIDKQTKGSGFRMLWSHKTAKHIECNGRGCVVCRSGKIIESSYLPIFTYKNKHLEPVDTDPSLPILIMSLIRTTNRTTVNIDKPITKQTKFATVVKNTFTPKQSKNEFTDLEGKAYLETYIRKNMMGQNNSRILKMFKNECSYFVQTDSKYCENLRGEHSSNHIWFIINDKTISQKCFCKCDTIKGRQNGLCKNFSGQKHVLTPTIIGHLYPKKITQTNIKCFY